VNGRIGLRSALREQADLLIRARELRRWTIPTEIDGADPSSLVCKPVRPDRAAALTHCLAQTLFLEWSRALDGWTFIGRPGHVVPEATRPYLDPEAPWAVLPDDEPEPLAWIQQPKEQVQVAESRADQILDAGVGVCVRCGAPTDRVLLGEGLFQGTIVEFCSGLPRSDVGAGTRSAPAFGVGPRLQGAPGEGTRPTRDARSGDRASKYHLPQAAWPAKGQALRGVIGLPLGREGARCGFSPWQARFSCLKSAPHESAESGL